MKYIDTGKLIAEIEKLKEPYRLYLSDFENGWREGCNNVIDDIIRKINSLQQEHEINGIKYKEVPAKTNDKICKDCDYFLDNGSCNLVDDCPCTCEDNILEKIQQEQTLLPSNLNEAALKAYPKMSRISEPHGVIPADNKTHYLGDANEENRVAFKAGAEWMVEQGISCEAEAVKDVGISFLKGAFEKATKEFDGKVIVQIRKKEE